MAKFIECDIQSNPKNDVEHFKFITNKIVELFAKKNKDYGDSFTRSLENYGNIAGLVRISDKFNRLENLLLNGGQEVSDESVKDTLIDLANYSIMLYMNIK